MTEDTYDKDLSLYSDSTYDDSSFSIGMTYVNIVLDTGRQGKEITRLATVVRKLNNNIKYMYINLF